MTRWHADLDMPRLARGATLMVFSEHQVVRVVVADTFSMQSPDGQRSSAIVMGREGGQIDLVEQDGRICSLRLVLDQSFPSPDEELDVFSRQTWVMH